MLRKARVKRLIAHLRTLRTRQVRLDEWGNSCGTTACIAGWATALFDKDAWRRFTSVCNSGDFTYRESGPWSYDRLHPSEVAQRALGLTNTQAAQLFYPNSAYNWWAKQQLGRRASQRDIAIKMLELLLEDEEIRRRREKALKLRSVA